MNRSFKAQSFKTVVYNIRIIIKDIQILLEQIETIVKEIEIHPIIQSDQLKLDDYLNKIKTTKLSLIDDLFLNEIRSIERFPFNSTIKSSTIKKYEQIMTNIINLQQLSLQFSQTQQEFQKQKLKDVKYEIKHLDQLTDSYISAAISDDLKFIVSGGTDSILKIWNYSDYMLIQEQNLQDNAYVLKFTNDCLLLYAGTYQGLLYCYDVQHNFQQTYEQQLHYDAILNLYCITNTIVLTSSSDNTIKKYDVSLNQSLFWISNSHDDRIDGLDYHKFRDIIATCSQDNSIKLWDNNNGSLLIQQQNAHNNGVYQIQFIISNDELISLDISEVNIWKIKYESKEFLKIQSITDPNFIVNVSLVLDQQFILLICVDYIKIYTIQLEYVNTIKHNSKELFMSSQIQLDSIKSIVIKEQNQLKILRLEI